jgi:RimJ/RimL family protein N-acetyltransferase
MPELKRTLRTKSGRPVTIRKAEDTDAAQLIDLINTVGAEKIYIVIERFAHTVEWEKNYIKNLNPLNLLYMVAELDRGIVGLLSLERETYKKTRHLASLGMVILKEYRREGIGFALVESSLEWAKKKGIEKIVLSCFSTNFAAIELYKRSGFKEESIRRRQFIVNGEYVDEIQMALWI